MKTKVLSLLSIVLTTFFIASCSNDDDNNNQNNIDVPNAVLTAFSSEYPTVANAKWEYENPYYIADFTDTGNDTEVWYNTDGTMMLAVQDLKSSQLPQAVLSAIAASNYKGWTFDDAKSIVRKGFSELYKVEMDDPASKKDVTLYYAANGTLIKEVAEVDNTPLKPIVIPQKIMDQLNMIFPPATYKIVDFDIDDTTKNYEVELYESNVAIEAVFDPQQTLQYYQWKTSFEAVARVVQNAFLEAGYAQTHIDDIYFRQTPNAAEPENAASYVFELEVNGKELVAIFNENGKRLQ